jgi:transcriptional regulator with XRE-family HTH domain
MEIDDSMLLEIIAQGWLTRRRLYLARTLLGLTQERMAQEIGCTVSTYNRWEKGRCKMGRLGIRSCLLLFERKGIEIGNPNALLDPPVGVVDDIDV